MTKRLLLRRKICLAWQQCRDDYNDCRINSERSLQAAFWFHLSEALGISRKAPRRIFIEPHLRIDGQDYYPDIVICNSRNVIGVVELKYQPRKSPSFEKDLNTLQVLNEKRDKDLSLENRRYSGPIRQRGNYHFSTDILFVWAGVHQESEKSRIELNNRAAKSICNFLQLHLETQESHIAEIPENVD